MSLFEELKRRNVFRAAVLYVGAVWALSQGIAQLAPFVGAPDWTVRWFLVAAAIGFPFFLAFSWFYEFTSKGLKRESEITPAESITAHTGRKMDRWIFAVMGLAIVLLLTDRFELGQSKTKEAAIFEHSIAVLPFTNLSADENQSYFSDGISEELINLLAKIPQLQVTARTSSFYFRGKDVSIPEIAHRLRVAYVLEGSVQKTGNQVRITALLVDATTDKQLWSQRYNRTLDDIFAIQDEIASDVVRQLEVKLLGAAPKARPTDPKAYTLYLQAKEIGQNLFTAEAFARSGALYREALEIDPRYVPAWAGLAANLISETNIGVLPSREGYERAREAAERALAIDPDYAAAHAQLGYISMYGDNDLAAAGRHFDRAMALDPTNLSVLGISGTFLQNLGRAEEALSLKEAVVSRDPVNAAWLFNLGIAQTRAARYDAAIDSFRTLLSLVPGQGDTHAQLGFSLLLKGDASAALAEFEQESNDAFRMVGLPMAYHALGRKADSDQALAALIAKYEKDWSYNIAYVFAFRGEADKAFEWLDKAVKYKDTGLAGIVGENLFDNIHSDPRWLPFLRELGKAPDQLAAIQFNVKLPQ